MTRPHDTAYEQKVGPFYDSVGVQNWLGMAPEAIQRRREARTILGCLTADQEWVYPIWQFQDNGELLHGLPAVLKVLANGIDDGWTWALWLRSAIPGELDNKTAIQWLLEGGDIEPVLRLAANDAAVWAT